MPRTNSNQELFRRLESLKVYRIPTGTIGDTTLAAAITASQATATIGATTNFTTSDHAFIIGTGGVELVRLSTALSTAQVLTRPVVIGQESGGRFVEAVEANLGYLDESGVNISPTQSLTPIPSAISALPINYISGVGEIAMTANLLNFSLPNLLTIMGIPESQEIGAGTAASPYQAGVLGEQMGTQGVQVLRATGSRFDGATVEVDFLDARIEVQGQITLNRTAPALLPLAIRCNALIMRHWQ